MVSFIEHRPFHSVDTLPCHFDNVFIKVAMSPYPKGSCVPLQPISLVEQPSLLLRRALLSKGKSLFHSSPNPCKQPRLSPPNLSCDERKEVDADAPSGVETLLASVPKSYPGGRAPLPIRSSGVPLLSVLVASSDLFLKVELVIPAPTKVIQQLGASPLLASIYALRSSY